MKYLTAVVLASILSLSPLAQTLAAEVQREWEAALEGAKREGKIVIAIPPSAELRKELEPLLKQKFGIEAELVVSRGADSANRIASEFKAGVRYFDAMIHGTTTALSLLARTVRSAKRRPCLTQSCKGTDRETVRIRPLRNGAAWFSRTPF